MTVWIILCQSCTPSTGQYSGYARSGCSGSVCVENCAKTGHSFCGKFYLVAVSVVAATVVAAAAVAVVAAAAAAGVAFLIESDMLINLDLVEGTVLPYPLTY
jgi:hypothetical protein